MKNLLLVVLAVVCFVAMPVKAQTTEFVDKGTEVKTEPTVFEFNFNSMISGTDSLQTYGFSPIGLFHKPFELQRISSQTNDSVKVAVKLQAYYSYLAEWYDLVTVGTDSVTTFRAYADTLDYYPDSLRVSIYGVAGNGDSTYSKGLMIFPK
jgi:hypothetical protein